MAERRFSIRSSKARDLAHRLARRENCTIAVFERALETYALREAGREPTSAFYTRLAAQSGADIDLEAVILESRRPQQGADF